MPDRKHVRSRTSSGEIRVADFDLEGAVADRVGVGKEGDKLVVGEVVVETTGIGLNLIAAAAQQLTQRQPELLGRQVP